MIFNKTINSTNVIGYAYPHCDLRTLPMLYRASADFASKQHLFYKDLLSVLDLSGGKYISMDVRTSMLMQGWYPSIPGWHCDDFYRPDGQPDLERLLPIKHLMLVLGADVSATEFIYQPIDLPSPTELYEVYDSENALYGYYNSIIEDKKPIVKSVGEGEIWQFGGLDFHRAVPAVKNGWRTFIRVTVSDHREPKNEIRTQTQVYLTDPFKGW